MKLSDIKISTQLQVGFGIIIVFIMIIGAIAWHDTDKIAQQNLDLYNHPLIVSKSLSLLQNDVLAISIQRRNCLLTPDMNAKQNAVQQVDILEKDVERQINTLHERYLGPSADIDHVYNAFVRWKLLIEKNMEQSENGTSLKEQDSLNSNLLASNERDQLMAYIQKMDDFALNKANQLKMNAESMNQSLNEQLALSLLIILLFSIVIVVVLSRHILRPLREVRGVTQRFREGDLTARSSYVSPNAIGVLAASFNDLADTIEMELTLNDHVAQLAGVMLSEEDAHRFNHALLDAMIHHTEAQMGAVYQLDEEKITFEPFESIGMNASGYHSFSALNYEGEFGAALSAKQMQRITDIPEDSHLTFSTVSGDFIPRELITIPIVVNNMTVAMISLATIKHFSNTSMRLLNSVLPTLNARMQGILAYQKIVNFSQQLEFQNSELEAQQRELAAQTAELTEQNVELAMQKKQLDEANKLKNSFLSSMSHELRTPLNSVIALSNVLTRRLAGKVPEEEFSYIGVIERNGKQLLMLINDILDLSRIEAGREEIRVRTFNVNNLIREVVEMIKPQANQKNIVLQCVIEESLPDIRSDFDKCRHILQNIVANSVKFTEEGQVEIRARADDDSIHIDIKDTGIGIKEEFLSHIFEEFRQADGSNSRKYGGTGLGLAIAKKYADILGGNIEVESTYGQGSRFSLILPLHITDKTVQYQNEPSVNHPILPLKEQVVDVTTKTILLVEDTEAIIIQMRDILETEGYHVLVARNGKEALEQMTKQVPHAMILDLMMPEVDGFEVLKRIRAEKKSEYLPVIILTAKYVTHEELAFLTHNSIFQLIHKGDINKSQLLNIVSHAVMSETSELTPEPLTPVQLGIDEKPTVLIVEDNFDNRLTIKALLDDRCVVLEAEDGKMGVELARKHQPQLILMDYALPGMNGVEALHELRNDVTTQHIPVIAVSASAMKGDKEDFLAHGFDGYISKPIDSKVFEETMKKWIGTTRQ
jgi:signal transduction histidine kinase/DNA-binding response OmpR family regulator/HAMP domain-containing protein